MNWLLAVVTHVARVRCNHTRELRGPLRLAPAIVTTGEIAPSPNLTQELPPS